jgi:hypothetical protein
MPHATMPKEPELRVVSVSPLTFECSACTQQFVLDKSALDLSARYQPLVRTYKFKEPASRVPPLKI